MCVHFEAHLDKERFRLIFGVEPPERPVDGDLWPGSLGAFVRRRAQAAPDDGGGDLETSPPGREALTGLFGLLPHWAKDSKIARHTVNARSESVATKPSYRDAWRRGQRCIVPATAFYEPDWTSGKAISTRLGRPDGRPFGLAGLWDAWTSPQGERVHSFTLLTIDAAGHALMRRFHRPGKEKRMVVLLAEDRFEAWLLARPEEAPAFLRPFPEVPLAVLAPNTAPNSASVDPQGHPGR